MDGKVDLFTLLTLIVALVLILKLRSVLGRRTEDDDQRIMRNRAEQQRQEAAAARSGEKVVTMPRREREEITAANEPTSVASVADAEARIKTFTGSDNHVTSGLLEVVRLDQSFDPDHFVRGAKQAYEMIVTAFAEGNRKILKDLLSRDVYDGFVGAIADREGRGEQIDQSFVGINKADIIDAEIKNGIANVTVRFVSQLISATRDRAGEVISGDPQKIKEVTDIWTFSRDISTVRARQNPNWRLIATQSPN